MASWETDRVETLAELKRRAVAIFGIDRVEDTAFLATLAGVAETVWRLAQEPLEPIGTEPDRT